VILRSWRWQVLGRGEVRKARAGDAGFPELARFLPRERKPWMSEDERMRIFDAAALAWLAAQRYRRQAPTMGA